MKTEITRDSFLATLRGANLAWIVGIFFFGVALTLSVPAIPTEPYFWWAINKLVSWVGSAAIAVVVAMAIADIKPFRDYLEQRLLRGLEAVRPGTIDEIERRLTEHISKDFLERGTSDEWLSRRFTQDEIKSLRLAIVRSSIANLDAQRQALLEDHIYPIFERPWRRDFRLSQVYTEVTGRDDVFHVVYDATYEYVNPSNRSIEFEQPVNVILERVEGENLEELTKPFRFKAGDGFVEVAWRIKENTPSPGQITLEAKVPWVVPPGGIRAHEHREFVKPRSDNFFHQRSVFLTKDMTISFNHPPYLRPSAYASFLGKESKPVETAISHQWVFQGWFLERHGVAVVWPP